MIKVYESKEKCCGCSACKNICPAKSIIMLPDEEDFLYPAINQELCIDCGLCQKVCPMVNALDLEVNTNIYGCKNKDKDEKFRSSSGGFFSILSREIINRGGIVYGAAFDSEFEVKHIGINNIKDLDLLRRSKYVQSDTQDAYAEIKELLASKDVEVLYSGTPCQIAGLKNFLEKSYDNLFLVDVVCHGVPSPGIFKKYLIHWITKYGSKIKSINFCAKEISIKALRIDFFNGKSIMNKALDDLYYKAFSNNIMLRPSCFNCMHNNFRSGSDITLADYWGASEISNEYQEKTDGVSLVIIKSDKGKKFFEQVKNQFDYFETTIDHAVKKNPNILYSSKRNSKRGLFFEDYKENIKILKLLRKYTKVSVLSKIVAKIKYEIKHKL